MNTERSAYQATTRKAQITVPRAALVATVAAIVAQKVRR